MNRPIFIDVNVPIFAAGRPHAFKEPCLEVLALAAERPEAFVTDAQVLQEILHRYLALRLLTSGREVLRRFATLMQGRIESVSREDVETAASLADPSFRLSARDLLHLAVMSRLGTNRIVSADKDFDARPSIVRLDPSQIQQWRDALDADPAPD